MVGGLFTVVLAFLGAASGVVLLWFRRSLSWLVESKRARAISCTLLVSILVVLLVYITQSKRQQGVTVSSGGGSGGRLVILGFDGLSATVAEALMADGRLPNFSALREAGSYRRLGTTTPPQSPVAWATFATGVGPGRHGVADFICRRDGTYLLDTVQTRFDKGRPVSPLRAPAFWDFAKQTGTPMDVLFCPLTFPPTQTNGVMHSGMGTPDVLGTQGTYTLFTTQAPAAGDDEGQGQVVHLPDTDEQTIELPGPRFGGALGKERRLTAKFGLRLDRSRDMVRLRAGNQTVEVPVGEWSPWLDATFPMGPFRKIKGIVRFHLNSVAPHLALYATAVCHDPRAPFHPISQPKDLAKNLANELGLYSTRGMPYDTWAFNDGDLDEAAFLKQAEDLMRERRRICMRQLDHCRSGVFFCYFDYSDVMQHMFWPTPDQDPPEQAKHIRECYQKMDEVLGEVRSKLNDGDTLMVLSDHGFTGFHQTLHLNSWLKRRGLLVLREGASEGRELFADVDWSRTRAYACGFNGVFLNLTGREPQGCVEPGESADALLDAIATGLAAWKDPKTGTPVLPLVKRGAELYSGEQMARVPDLVVGPAAGYRVSWQTALGAVPSALMEANNKRWRGTHLTHPDAVPGILFSNRPITIDDPTLYDFAPTILRFMELPADGAIWQDLKGRNLLEDAR
jgi:predicted AlkP superfamily phosphohydrolase/phosphomutase